MAVLILNGSPSGRNGNCQVLIQKLKKFMKNQLKNLKAKDVQVAHLAEYGDSATKKKALVSMLKKADGFIFVTGTYWDSWGSPLQIFLENMTDFEGTSMFVGKPAVVLVLNHSVGGKGVLSRLQGVLSTLGCLIPPMSGMVYSWVADQLLKNSKKFDAQKDLWSLEDVELILENFQKALGIDVKWGSWPVDRNDYKKNWLK